MASAPLVTCVPMTVPPRRFPTVCLCAALLAAGCVELPTGTDVRLVSGETRAALQMAEELPDLAALLEKHGAPEELDGPRDAWRGSWDHNGPVGREIRAGVYDRAVPFLAGELGPPELDRLLQRVEQVVDQADRLPDIPLPMQVRPSVERARASAESAGQRLAMGEDEAALRAILEAADALRAVAPRKVARELVQEARDAVEAVGEPEWDASGEAMAVGNPVSVSERDLERARRLQRGADRALERGQYEKAIRRAYYARQLLEDGRH